MRPIVIYKRYAVVKVPFPFVDRQASKNRPALVLSDENTFNAMIGHTVMAMITSAKHSDWPLDTVIQDLEAVGLKAPSKIRLKLFTLDNRFILRQLGQLSQKDRDAFEQNLKQLLPLS
jgi:mRNA interferase MazF